MRDCHSMITHDFRFSTASAQHHASSHEPVAETTQQMPPESECVMSGNLGRQVIGWGACLLLSQHIQCALATALH